MDFNKAKKEELVKLGESFAVDVNLSMKKEEIIDTLIENGVTPEEVARLNSAADEAEPVVETQEKKKDLTPENAVLVRMIRTNPTYETHGYKFTREHPFALVDPEDADDILEFEEGFRIASPKEAAEYYG